MADVLRMIPVATERVVTDRGHDGLRIPDSPGTDPAMSKILDALVLVARNMDALTENVGKREMVEKSETSALVRKAIDGLHVITACRDCGDEFSGTYRETEAWTRRHRDEHLGAVALEVVRHGPGRVVPRKPKPAKPETSPLDRLRKASRIRVEPASEPVTIEKLSRMAGVAPSSEPAPAAPSIDVLKRKARV